MDQCGRVNLVLSRVW